MDAFNLFILNTHQVFFALLAGVFTFFAYRDLDTIKDNIRIEKRKYFAIVFVTMFVGLTFTFLESWNNFGIFFSVEFALLVTFSLLSPKYAISFFVYLLLSRPWETFDNQLMQSMPRDIFYLTALSLLGHKIAKKEMFVRINIGTLLIVLFASWVFLSAFFSNNQADSIYNYAEVFSKGIIVFILIQNSFTKTSDMIPAKAALVLAIIEKSIVSFYNTMMIEAQNTSGVVLEDGMQRLESVGILSNSNDVAAIFILAIPFTLFFILKTKLKPFSWLLASGAIIVMSYLVWQSQSRGAMLALFATFGAYFFLQVKSKKHIAMIATIAIIGALGSFSLMNRKGADLEGSTNNRIIFWKAGANMAIRNPVFGVGFWGFNDNFSSYAIDGDTGSESKHMTAHSSWFQVVAETGFMGLFFFLSLWLYAGFKAWQIRKTHPEYFMSIAGYGVCVTFLSHAYLLFPYILLSLAITESFLLQEDIVESARELNEPIAQGEFV